HSQTRGVKKLSILRSTPRPRHPKPLPPSKTPARSDRPNPVSVERPGRLLDQFAQDRHQAPKFTRCGPPRGKGSGGVLDDLDQAPHAFDESLANRPMIQIVQFEVQTEFSAPCDNRLVANHNRAELTMRPDRGGQSSDFSGQPGEAPIPARGAA